MNQQAFIEDLEQLLNRHSMENESNTPDFILAAYLYDCLMNFNKQCNDEKSGMIEHRLSFKTNRGLRATLSRRRLERKFVVRKTYRISDPAPLSKKEEVCSWWFSDEAL